MTGTITCPDCGTITELEVCPYCNIVLTGKNKGEEALRSKPKKPKAE